MRFLSRQFRHGTNTALTTDPSSQPAGSDLTPNPTASHELERQAHPVTPWPVKPSARQWSAYVRPLWWISLGLHLGLLRLPLPAPHAPSAQVKSVKITKLTPENTVKKTKIEAAPLPKVPPAGQAKVASPAAAVVPPPIATNAQRLQSQSQRQSQIQDVSKKPALPARSSTPTPSTTPSSTPSPTTQKTPNRQDETVLKNFPQYPGAETGCMEYCIQTQASLTDVAAFFEKQLSATWSWEALPSEDPTQKVYRIEKDGVIRFLSLLMAQPAGTMYILATDKVTQETLKQTEDSAATISDILADNVKPLETVDKSSTTQPQLFTRASDIVSLNLVQNKTPDAVWQNSLQDAFKSKGFEVSDTSKPYGGGPVYVIQRASFTGYLNLVPSEDGKGTVIVFWKVLPS